MTLPQLLDSEIVYGALAELVLTADDVVVLHALENEDFRSRLTNILSLDRRVKDRLIGLIDLLPIEDQRRIFLKKHMNVSEPRPYALVLGPECISGFSCPLRIMLTRIKFNGLFDEIQLVNCTSSTLTRVTLFARGQRTVVGDLHAFQKRSFRFRVTEERLFVRADFFPEHEATDIFVVRCVVPEDFQ